MDKLFINKDNIISFFKDKLYCDINKPVLVCGSNGSGKHFIAEYLLDKYKLSFKEINNKLNYITDIDEIYLNNEPTLYLINLDEILSNHQDSLLKLVEEPPKAHLIYLITSRFTDIKQTLCNRCYLFTIPEYTVKQLDEYTQFAYKDKQLSSRCVEVCKTPGEIDKIINMPLDLLEYAYDLPSKIHHFINNATLSNIMSICNKIAFKGEKDKIDLNILFNILKSYFAKQASNTDISAKELNKLAYCYSLIVNAETHTKSSNINKKYVFESLLIDLRYALGDS